MKEELGGIYKEVPIVDTKGPSQDYCNAIVFADGEVEKWEKLLRERYKKSRLTNSANYIEGGYQCQWMKNGVTKIRIKFFTKADKMNIQPGKYSMEDVLKTFASLQNGNDDSSNF